MKALLLFVLLVGLAALNLVLNYTVPTNLKLVLVPVVTLAAILIMAKTVRRQP